MDYADIIASANAMLSEFGRSVTVRSVSASGVGYDPIVTASDRTITAAFSVASATLDGQVQGGDLEMVTTSQILQSDKVVDGGKTYSVVQVEEVKPGSTAVLYIAVLRR